MDIVLADSNVSSDARRDVKCDRTMSRLSDSERASRLDGRDARDNRLLISVGDASVAVSASALAVDEKSTDDRWSRVLLRDAAILVDEVENAAVNRMPPLRLEMMAAAVENIMMAAPPTD